jgi:hypothetical protein
MQILYRTHVVANQVPISLPRADVYVPYLRIRACMDCVILESVFR